ncbi:MAG: hypothetical protein Q4E54_00235 [Lachnospiraceae bacterium]|nr:hypothetical protein [Lachnospiraceae bacterium]
MKRDKKITNAVICGFDAGETEKRADIIMKKYGMSEYELNFVSCPVQEDGGLICHMIAVDDTAGDRYYIHSGRADIIYARTPIEACRNFGFLRFGGTVEIETFDSGGFSPVMPQTESMNYIKTYEEMGAVQTIIH